MERGEHGKALYVLLSGSVVVESGGGDSPTEVMKVMSTGEVFGIAALMCGKPRVASARAAGATTVLVLDWQRLQGIARLFPRSAYLIFRNLSMITGERLAHRVAAGNADQRPPNLTDAVAPGIDGCGSAGVPGRRWPLEERETAGIEAANTHGRGKLQQLRNGFGGNDVSSFLSGQADVPVRAATDAGAEGAAAVIAGGTDSRRETAAF